MKVEVYLSLDGRCEAALEFYRDALGAEIQAMMRFKDAPDPYAATPDTEDKIMHACFKIGETSIMASDGRCNPDTSLNGFSLSLLADSPAEAERLFKALAEEGNVTMPLEKTFWSPLFGMVTDKFGVPWMINTAEAS